MLNKKNKKQVQKKRDVFEPETYPANSNFHLSEDTKPIEECAVHIAVNEVPMVVSKPDVAVDETTTPKVTMPEPLAGDTTAVEPLYDNGEGNVMEETSVACGSMPKQSQAPPYTQPPVQLLIGPEEIVHYASRHLLPHNFVHDGLLKQVSLRGIDIGTGHTLIHYFHTGTYETIDTYGDSTMLNTGIKLKHALSVYLASIDHDIPGLNALAISEMRTHASTLDLVEVLRASGEGFQRLGPESWLHEYLQRKAKAAFEENHAVFTSQAFLDTLDNPMITKFMMRCMAECYGEKISRMDIREKEMSQFLNDCQNDLRVLSQKKGIAEQDNAVQHQLITPLASEDTISDCCEIETFGDDLVSNEDFCTISCPPSEYANEPRGCPEEITHCSAEPREHFQNAKKMISHEPDSAGPMSNEQRLRSIYLAPDASIEASHGPTGEAAAAQCSWTPQRSHHVFEMKTSRDNVTAETVMDEDEEKKEKKETKKQRKTREKREQREMKELWEAVKQYRSDPDKGGDKVAGSEVQPTYQDKAHKGPIRDAGAGDERNPDLEAAIALILKDVRSIQSFRSL